MKTESTEASGDLDTQEIKCRIIQEESNDMSKLLYGSRKVELEVSAIERKIRSASRI